MEKIWMIHLEKNEGFINMEHFNPVWKKYENKSKQENSVEWKFQRNQKFHNQVVLCSHLLIIVAPEVNVPTSDPQVSPAPMEVEKKIDLPPLMVF